MTIESCAHKIMKPHTNHARRMDSFELKTSAVGFKSAEIALRSSKLQFLLHCLRSKDVIAAGMSSFGPIVFAILESDRERPLVHDMVKTSAAGIIEWTTADNAGYVIHP